MLLLFFQKVLLPGKVFFLFLISYILLATFTCLAQSLTEIEKQYDVFSAQLNREYETLDSLNRLFSQKAKQIDDEKNRKDPDKENIIKLMSLSANVSNNIDRHQEKIKELERNNGAMRKNLSKRYNDVIDSLKILSSSGTKNSHEIESQILYYTERKLIIEPGIQNLSYKPEKMLNFRVNNPTDKKEVTAYSEYLSSALNEVNAVIDDITEKSSGLKTIISLQKKTQKFLKEVEMESRPGSPRYSVKSDQTTTGGVVLNDLPGTKNQEAYYVQAHAYTLLLDQLSFDKSINSNLKWEYNFDKDKSINLHDYNELLKEVKKNLVEYKTILQNKLDSLK